MSGGPTVVRFPKGKVGGEVEAIAQLGGMDVLSSPGEGRARTSCSWRGRDGADRPGHRRPAGRARIGVTVVDPRWTKPVDEVLVAAARQHRLVVTVEDNGRACGFGDAVARLLRDHDVDVPAKTFGVPQE